MSAPAQLIAALASRYRVEGEIGRGGMATVYLAHDLRHERRVALKVLNPELGAVLGVERFLAEIRVTANLQHPNLLPLFDSGEADGLLFYVMPYVEGESLRARLDREKQLPIDEAVRIATAVASALDYAHRHNVIHRDLKPENILLHEGQPLVADFGIALAVSNAGGARVTQTGLSLGTPQYMSPEQATGERGIDSRADIYSLGALTYEMIAGEPPHTGPTAQAIIAKLMTEEPRSLTVLRRTVPPHVDDAVRCALEKLPADRFATAHEFSDALTTARPVARRAGLSSAGSPDVDTTVSFTIPTGRARRVLPWVLVAALVGVAAWGWLRTPPAAPERTVRFTLAMPATRRNAEGLLGTYYALSPDGRRIAFLASDDLGSIHVYVRAMDQLTPRLIEGSRNARNPAFSPDGQWIAFTIGPDVMKVAVDGGPLLKIGAAAGSSGLSWGVQDTILVGGASLVAIPASGGASRTLIAADGATGTAVDVTTGSGIGVRWPLALPDGETVLYTNWAGVGGRAGATEIDTRATLNAISMSTGKVTPLGLAGTFPMGIIDGLLIYGSGIGAVMAVPFDAAKLRVTGNAVPVVQEVIVDAGGALKAVLSPRGDLVYLSGQSLTVPVLVDERGVSRTLIDDVRVYSTPRFSPDGGRIAFTVGSGQNTDVWIYDLAKGTLSRLTTNGGSMRPEWSSDGSRVVFRSEREKGVGIWWQAADGSAPAELLFQPDLDPYEVLLSPDGKHVLYRTSPGARNSRDIFSVALDGDRKPVPLVTSQYAEQGPRLSPDGRWLAYQSDESSQVEVYVRPFPSSGGRIQISTTGGADPLWSRDGRTLFYRVGARVMAASVETSSGFAIGSRRVVLEGDFLHGLSHPNYDIAPDGKRLLMIKRAGGQAETIVVHNWLADVRRRLAAER